VPAHASAAAKLLEHAETIDESVAVTLLEVRRDGMSRWTQLVRDDNCVALVDALLKRLRQLGAPAITAALAPGYTHLYDPLVARAGIAVTDEVVALLLAPAARGGVGLWMQLVLDGPWPLVARLMKAHPELQKAALHSDVLAKAASPARAGVMLRLIEAGAKVDDTVERAVLEGRADGSAMENLLVVDGLPFGYPRQDIMGFYRPTDVEAKTKGVVNLKPDELSRRRVYQQVGGECSLWFRIKTYDKEAAKGDDDDGDGDDDEGGGDDDEGGVDDDEPEEQEGSWIISSSDQVGSTTVDVLASAVDAAMKPTEIVEAWSTVTNLKIFAATPKFMVRTATKTLKLSQNVFTTLVINRTFAPLVDAILERSPALGKPAIVAALDADDHVPFVRLSKLNLELPSDHVDRLLKGNWVELLLDEKKWLVAEALMKMSERLRASALSPETLAASMTPASASIAVNLIEMGGALQTAEAVLTADKHRLADLIASEKAAPLLAVLLAKLPELRPHVLVSALLAPSTSLFSAVQSRYKLSVDSQVVELLVAEKAGGSRWAALLADERKWSLATSLMAKHPPLKAAAIAPATLRAMLAPKTAAVAAKLIDLGALVSSDIQAALLQVDKTAAGGVLLSEPNGELVWMGKYLPTGRMVADRKVYKHSTDDFALWYDDGNGMWILSRQSMIGDRIGNIVPELFAIQSSDADEPKDLDSDWRLFNQDTNDAEVTVAEMSANSTVLSSLVNDKACEPLVEKLVAAAPALKAHTTKSN